MEYKILVHKTKDKTEYGIGLFDCGTNIHLVPDITDNKHHIQQLTDILNAYEIEPCHFEYIIEDFLTDFSV